MRKAIACLAFILLLILAMSVVDAGTPAVKVSNPMIKPNPQLFAPYIHVNSIKVAPAAPGNSKAVTVNVNVTSRVTQTDICGLNATNFGMEGPAHIASVLPISGVAVNQPMTCDYVLSIVPNSPWVTGTNAFKLDYIQGGQQIANVTLMFRV
jgi:hypothetical protein